MILGVIPARGGSKGIPRKNLRLINGISLLEWAIKSAKAATKLDRFVVSTDDAEIADEARRLGATPPFLRPAELSTDSAPTWRVLAHAVDWCEQSTHGQVDAVVTLQPTTPLRQATDIDAAIAAFRDDQPGADSLVSACRAQSRHPLTLYVQDDNNPRYLHTMMSGLSPTTRRQDFPPIFWRNGAIYITRRDLLMDGRRVVSDRPLMYEMPEERSINIDSWIDLAFADFWSRTKGREGS